MFSTEWWHALFFETLKISWKFSALSTVLVFEFVFTVYVTLFKKWIWHNNAKCFDEVAVITFTLLTTHNARYSHDLTKWSLYFSRSYNWCLLCFCERLCKICAPNGNVYQLVSKIFCLDDVKKKTSCWTKFPLGMSQKLG